MSDENNELQIDPHKLQEDIENLQSKYTTLSDEVNQLENNKISINADLKQIHNEFEQLNKNMGDILQKLNKLSDGFAQNEGDPDDVNKTSKSMKKMFTNPLRRVAVGTLSAAYTVTDKTMEKVVGMKESFEDIVAEAKYANKKSKMKSAENN